MATWPESNPQPSYPLIVSQRYETDIVKLGGGKEQRRSVLAFPLHDVVVTYFALSATEIQTLWNFHQARRGACEAFYIYDLALRANIAPSHLSHYVATADGTLTTFDIPGRNTSAHTVYADGVEKSAGSEYSILAGGGAASADRIQFATAPVAGTIITVDFTGFLRCRVRFEEDIFNKELFNTTLYANNLAISLKGTRA